jgi:pilus assembly protein CpaE
MTSPNDQLAEAALSNLIIAEDRSWGQTVLHAMSRIGRSSGGDKVVAFDQVVQAVQSRRTSEQRVIVVIGSSAQQGLEIVRRIRSLSQGPLFVIGPRDADLILDSIHAGASDFIENSDNLDENLVAAFSRQKNQGSSEEGRLICVAAVRGGCGSSIISVNLTAALVQHVKRAVLCDFDLDGGVCDALLNLKPKHSILDLRRCLERLDSSSVEMAITKHASGVHLLSAPVGPFDREVSLSELCQPVIRTAKQMYPFVVADLPRLCSNFDIHPLLSICDKLIVVTQMDFNSIRSARRALERFHRAGIVASRISIVGNRVGQPNELPLADAERALNSKIEFQLPDDSKSVNRSINCGVPYVIGSPATRLAKAVESLAISLTNEGQPAAEPEPARPIEPAVPAVNLTHLLRQWGDWMTNRGAEMEAST